MRAEYPMPCLSLKSENEYERTSVINDYKKIMSHELFQNVWERKKNTQLQLFQQGGG